MSEISKIIARKIIDSRGNPTVEVEIYYEGKLLGMAAAPSGASKGKFEVKDYPNNNIDEGIIKFNDVVSKKLVGMNLGDQKNFDKKLHEIDMSENFSNIGGNVAIAASLSYAKASAKLENLWLFEYVGKNNQVFKLPKPLGNIIGGGKHAINGTVMQEFLAVSSGKNYESSAFANVMVHKKVGEILKSKFPELSLGLGDEKAWVAPLKDIEAFQILSDAIKSISEKTGVEIGLAVDLAASEFYDNGKYQYKDKSLSTDEQIEYISQLVKQFNIKIIEDPLDEEDFEGFGKLTKKIGNETLIVGDDLFVTNKERLQKGISLSSGNAILIKPNQIGTLSDMIDTVILAKKNNYESVISHRSGETEDTSIAHLAVGLGISYIKTGTVGGERTAKHNELIRIEQKIKK
ncbi:MAG: hypothetical protein QXD23_01580 [Candidatus Micrarchaeaceae archaeon]